MNSGVYSWVNSRVDQQNLYQNSGVLSTNSWVFQSNSQKSVFEFTGNLPSVKRQATHAARPDQRGHVGHLPRGAAARQQRACEGPLSYGKKGPPGGWGLQFCLRSIDHIPSHHIPQTTSLYAPQPTSHNPLRTTAHKPHSFAPQPTSHIPSHHSPQATSLCTPAHKPHPYAPRTKKPRPNHSISMSSWLPTSLLPAACIRCMLDSTT